MKQTIISVIFAALMAIGYATIVKTTLDQVVAATTAATATK